MDWMDWMDWTDADWMLLSRRGGGPQDGEESRCGFVIMFRDLKRYVRVS